ncbi:yemanuclein isoform X2 [Sabethes cyaneus]|uniref:yemanuclein isoform X2 n=1 Tax=Sabethes cyaneus TaxID=53552 RepID=UPI00237E288D|nr:yemanuclein isoform X2 [Sabethes cyaneus]
MSDMKRVALTTIGDAVKKSPFGGSGSDQNTNNFFSGALASSKSGTSSSSGSSKDRKTVRLELKLFEPTENSFPEFSFAKLVREEQKRQRKIEKKSTANGFLPEPDDNSDVARIARELEKKYGSGTAYSSSGKFARPTQLDYCDRGAGYDEEDSFIDNTEAYDEIIPEEIETVCGGFYINSGPLEFKKLSNFERPEDALRMPKRKKRALSSSSEDSSDREDTAKAVPKKVVTKKKDELGAGSATSGTDSTAGKGGKLGKKRLNGHVVKKVKMTAEKQANRKATGANKEKKKKKESKVINAEAVGGKDVKVVKTTTVKDMLRAKRDSLRKMEQEKKGGRSSGSGSTSEADEDGENDGTDDGSDSSESDSSDSGSDDSESDSASASEPEKKVDSEAESKKLKEVKLPDNLPDHLLQDLSSLKDIAKNTSGKLNFFDATVADLLLQIDVSSRMCGGSARNAIYKHLELHLQVSRQTLMVKIKKIRIRKEDNKVKKALNKLEDVVTELMPKVLTNYENERQKAIELRNAQPTTSENSEKTDIKYPKKKFPWNDQLRTLLFEVAAIRKQSFHILRPRKETEEDYVNSYLKKSVVPLWPTGWMKFEELQKELDRRKKADMKAANKEVKKTVQLSAVTASAVLSPVTNGPGGGKPDAVLTPAVKQPKTDEKKLIRPAQQSPIITATNMTQPSPSTSPAGLKKTSDHSIINIISSPPSKSSSHSSHPLAQQQPQPLSQMQQQQQQQPPRPQSQPPRPPLNFDEDLIQTHIINLEVGPSTAKRSPINPTTIVSDYPKDLRINSPALSSASSASSSRRQSSYQDPSPPMAHTTPTTIVPSSSTGRKDRKSLDDDSDSSIEIIGEYNVADKHGISPVQQKVDPLNLALPSLNKDKYKNIGNSSGKSSSSSSSTIHGGFSKGATSATNFNNNLEKAKYVAPTAASTSGSFALPTMAGLMQSNSSMPPKATSIPGELDVIRIMKELQELQAIQMNSMNKASLKSDSPKPAHIFPSTSKKTEPVNHKTQSPGPAASQHQQQSHHKKPVVMLNGALSSPPASKASTENVSKPEALAATSKKATQN